MRRIARQRRGIFWCHHPHHSVRSFTSILAVKPETSAYPYSVNTTALSRLLLNLRDVAHGSQRTMTPISTVRFSRIVGPLGNVVHDGLSFREDEDNKMVDMVNGSDNIPSDEVGGE